MNYSVMGKIHGSLLYLPLQRSWNGGILVTLSVCRTVDRMVFALYLQQYSPDPFHIYTSYQATSEGVSRIKCGQKSKHFGKFINFVTLRLPCFDLEHDDIIKWKHFPRYWPFVRRIHRSPVNSPHKGQWRGALMFSLICARINGWVNNREAGDLRRHQAHCDVIVMIQYEWINSMGNHGAAEVSSERRRSSCSGLLHASKTENKNEKPIFKLHIT